MTDTDWGTFTSTIPIRRPRAASRRRAEWVPHARLARELPMMVAAFGAADLRRGTTR